MNPILNHALPYEKYFEEICQHPHNSYKEDKLGEYLIKFAEKQGLPWKQDSLGNIIIYKNGSCGYEDHPPLILQAHIDMICEKRPESDHDFEKDALDLEINDGWLYAKGTTLGADDGVGVAYMLAVLEDTSLSHPPLECLFTVQEEVGCMGAAALKAADFRSTQLLGLDEVSGDTTTVSGAGMKRALLSYHAVKTSCDLPCFHLAISGLAGGHSGDDIHRERGNANKLAGRFLYTLHKLDPALQIASIDGGVVDNAICKTSTIIFASSQDISNLEATVSQLAAAVQEELHYSDPGFEVKLEACASVPVFSPEDSLNIIRFLYLCPDGFRHKSMRLALTTASSNLGILKTTAEGITASIYIRGAALSFIETIAGEILELGSLLNWTSQIPVSLPCWEYREDSPLRNSLKKAYQDVTGKEMKEHAEHGCLEAGHFTAMKPEMDIATLGPLVVDYHTYDERLNLKSFREIYEVLIQLMKNL